MVARKKAGPPKVTVGKYYRHFKGRLIRVTGLATHTETKEELVIYQEQAPEYRLWARPKSMFSEMVDKKKYPNATQEYRFEEAPPPRLK